MKKSSLLIVILLTIFFGACIKDRTKAVSSGPVNTGGRKLIHYWGFNTTGDTTKMIIADTNLVAGGKFSYNAAYIDTLNPGTSLNARPANDSGGAVRLRNPYVNMTIQLPTTGYKQPIFTFACERSNSGPTANNIEYTTDGVNFITTGLSATSFTLGTTWTEFSVDFSSISAVDDNPKFAIRFTPTTGNTGLTGNDRYDNISLDAYPK